MFYNKIVLEVPISVVDEEVHHLIGEVGSVEGQVQGSIVVVGFHVGIGFVVEEKFEEGDIDGASGAHIVQESLSRSVLRVHVELVLDEIARQFVR